MAEIWQWVGLILPWLVLVLCVLVGLVGTLLPAVPGGAMILLGTWTFALWTGLQRAAMDPPQPWLLGWPTLTLVTVLAFVGGIGQYFVSGLGAKQFGASNWGVAGALLGFVIGLGFTPLGALVGAFLGAALVEYLVQRLRQRRASAAVEEGEGEPEEAAGEDVTGVDGESGETPAAGPESDEEPDDTPEVSDEGDPGDPATDTVDGNEGAGQPGRWSRIGGHLAREGKVAGKASVAGFGAVLGAVASFLFEFIFGLMMVLVIVIGLLI